MLTSFQIPLIGGFVTIEFLHTIIFQHYEALDSSPTYDIFILLVMKHFKHMRLF